MLLADQSEAEGAARLLTGLFKHMVAKYMGTHIFMPVPTLEEGVIELSTHSTSPTFSKDVLKRLRDGIASSRSSRGLSPEARVAIIDLCSMARSNSWTPEQLLIAVKDACYSSPEISSLTTTSERDAVLAKIVTGCINEFYKPRDD